MDLLFDIGGTNMRLALTDSAHRFDRPLIFPTPLNYREGVKQFLGMADQLLSVKKVKRLKRVVGGVPGPVDAKHQRLLNAPHLKDWANRPFAADLRRFLNASVFLENDAALVGLGEAVAGGGKGKKIVAYITVSTGVGGVRIVNGHIDVSANGFEPGHQMINLDPLREWEQMVSGTAVQKLYKKSPHRLVDPAAWERLAFGVAVGLHNTIVHWSPDIVVLGGSMMIKKPGIPLQRIEHHLHKILKIFSKPPRLVKAKLQDVGGLYGALALLHQTR